MYQSGYTCGFFPSRKSNINATSTFSLREGFASLPEVKTQAKKNAPRLLRAAGRKKTKKLTSS